MIARAEERLRAGRRTVFFLDEIHRFNKAQQDALLPAVEDGLDHADRRDHREPVLRGQLGAALPRADLRAPPARRRGGRRAAAPCARATPSAASRSRPTVDEEALAMLVSPRRRRRPPGARRAGAGGRDRRPRRPGRPGDGRGRPAAQGGPLRQGGRQALRLHLGLDQGHPRVRRRRVGLLPRGDARGRGGPALHRAPDGHLRLRGHRQRRPCRRSPSRPRSARPSTASGFPSAGSTSPREPSTSRSRRSPTPPTRRCSGPRSTFASTAPPSRRRRCGAPPTRAPRSSGGEPATAIPTTTPARSTTSGRSPSRSPRRRFYEPSDRGFEAELADRLKRIMEVRESGGVKGSGPSAE